MDDLAVEEDGASCAAEEGCDVPVDGGGAYVSVVEADWVSADFFESVGVAECYVEASADFFYEEGVCNVLS